ncbi:hypothetical protein KI387_019450, partial [Taxus chinensis]
SKGMRRKKVVVVEPPRIEKKCDIISECIEIYGAKNVRKSRMEGGDSYSEETNYN